MNMEMKPSANSDAELMRNLEPYKLPSQIKTTTVAGFTRKRAERNSFPEHLPRERVVIDPPTACECCGSNRLR